MEGNDTLSNERIHAGLRTAVLGQQIQLLPSVHSTNRYIKEYPLGSVNNGFTVIAEEQTAGRGRKGRVFYSPAHEGIYMSVLWKPAGLQPDIRLLTIHAAVAVSKAIEKTCAIRADIKWVNDIFCNGKKICGILAEGITSADVRYINAVVIGVGINTGHVPQEVADIATSIGIETGKHGIRNRLIAEVLNQLETALLDNGDAGKCRDMLAYYAGRLWIVGKRVLMTDTERPYSATVLGVNDDGALMVRDDGGVVHSVTTGEIRLTEYIE